MNLKLAQDQHRSYADNRRRDLEFEVGDRVFLKLSPWKGVQDLVGREKVESKVFWTFRDLGNSWTGSIRLALPMEMSKIHNVFHVLVLRKYILILLMYLRCNRLN